MELKVPASNPVLVFLATSHSLPSSLGAQPPAHMPIQKTLLSSPQRLQGVRVQELRPQGQVLQMAGE
jgi:hypothetical protein